MNMLYLIISKANYFIYFFKNFVLEDEKVEGTPIKRSTSTNIIIGYLKKRIDNETNIRQEEMALRKEELKLKRERVELEKKERQLRKWRKI